jgi:ferrous iron transport protein B
MATRTLPHRRDRLLTMLVLPLMTCSARLPVYSLLIAVLIPNESIWGLNLPALVLLGFYVLATIMSILMMGIFSKFFFATQNQPPLLLELPDYRMPSFKGLGKRVLNRAKIFLEEAGTVILAGTIVLWLLLAFPRLDDQHISAEQKASFEQEFTQLQKNEPNLQWETWLETKQKASSFAGMIGHTIEPLIRPMGWDWQIAVGMIGAFAAREVFVSTLGIVYGVGSDVDEEDEGLRQKIKEAKHTDGTPVFTVASGMALMVFFAFACQCLSTLAVIKRESGSYLWTGFVFAYMTILAYLSSLFTYYLLS